jgi:hypothetical protein
VKKFLGFILLIAGLCFAQHQNDIYTVTAPTCAYKCVRDSFNRTDSSFRTTILYSGEKRASYWIMVAPGVTDSCIIYVHPSDNTDTTVRFPVKIRASETGIPLPMGFDKIFKIGTTAPLDSIWYGPYLWSRKLTNGS